MASKLAVAGIIEGNFTDEGLSAMSDCADMTTALARELTQGIRHEVEDLSSVFKKMARLKTEPDFWLNPPEVTVWDESTLTDMDADFVADDFVDIGNIENIEDTTDEIKPMSTVITLYDPNEENIQKDVMLQKFRQFKTMFASSNIPNSALLEMLESMLKDDNPALVATGIPNDFDPFANEAIAA
jgi:hypothetical protein